MTTNKTEFTLTSAMSLTLEQLQVLPTEALNEAMNTLKASAQKKAGRKADLIAGILKGRSKEAEAGEPEASEQLELVPVENSVKAPKKPKASGMKMTSKTPKGKKAPKPEPEADGEMLADAKFHGDAEAKPKKTKAPKAKAKAETPEPTKAEPKKSKSLKRKKSDAPDVDKMSEKELRELAKNLTAKVNMFPDEIRGENTSYVNIENFETVKEMQKFIIENPLRLHVFADEKLDDNLTQFLVLFVNEDVIVLLDRNRDKNTTLTVPMKNFTADTITFDKMKFKYSFYVRQ